MIYFYLILHKNKDIMANSNIKKPRFRYPILLTIKTYFFITIGLIIYSFAWTAFLLPFELVSGGISGISAMIYYFAGYNFGLTYFIINAILLFAGAKALGLRLGIKTIYAVLVISLFFILFKEYFEAPVVENLLISALAGGLLAGIGIGIVFTQGGSIGGTDIIAMLIEKYRAITPGRMILLFDVIIIGSSYFLFESIEIVVYGIIIMAVMFYAKDMLLMGERQSVQMFIFSRKYDEIAKRIANDIGRGVTLVNAKGWYSREGSYLLMIVVRKHETSSVYKSIKEIDPEAFITVANVMGVFGKGFDPVKH